MLLFDAHLDLGWNANQWTRDLRLCVDQIRASEAGLRAAGRGTNTVALPELRRGRVAFCLATTLARNTGSPFPILDYATADEAHDVARGHIAYYRALERQRHARVITTRDSLDQHEREWSEWESERGDEQSAPPLGIIVSMESADPILSPEDLREWKDAGVRAIGPAHYGSGRYAGGTGCEDSLTAFGFELIKEMRQHNIALDMTHLSDKAFWQALDIFDGTIWASHNNCRALVPHQRQFSDAQLKAIIQRDGVIGAALDIWMLIPGYDKTIHSPQDASLETVVDHIEHVCQLAGNSLHAGIGSDLDGGFGREQSPGDLDTIADLQRLPNLLTKRGFSSEDIDNIMHRNWLRKMREVLE
jgi:membrane dipeptidase